MDAAPRDADWRARARKLLFWGIVVELVALAATILAMAVAERSRIALLTLYAPRQPLLAVAILGAALAPLTRRHVRALVAAQLSACLLVVFPVMGLEIGSARASEFPVRLATYNVYFGKLDRAHLLDEISAMRADIIVLQATYDSMGARVRERFPDRSTHHVDDFILVTRYRIAGVDVPPPLPDGTLAKFVGYVLETDAGPLRVYNVHPFSPRQALFDDKDTEDNIRHREEQVAAVVAAARREGTPFIIAGDTNLPALSAVKRRYFGGMRDAFDEVGFGFGYTFPAKRPWMRIDRVFGGEGIRFVDARVGERGASDHLPLFVQFEMPHR